MRAVGRDGAEGKLAGWKPQRTVPLQPTPPEVSLVYARQGVGRSLAVGTWSWRQAHRTSRLGMAGDGAKRASRSPTAPGRDFAPAGDPLSLLVQRKWAKKAPEHPCGSRSASAGVPGRANCRAALAKLCSTDATDASGCNSDHRRTRPLPRISPTGPQRAVNPGDRVRQRSHADSGIGGAVEQGFARGCEQSQVLNAWPPDHRLPHGCSVFQVLSLRPFFAPAKKGCRPPGRNPAGGGGRPTRPLCTDSSRPSIQPAAVPSVARGQAAPRQGRRTTTSAPPSGWLRALRRPPWRSTRP